MLKTVKNNDNIVRIWCGQELQPQETFTIPDSKINKWANDNEVLSDLVSGKLTLNNITDINLAINTLKDNLPTEVLSIGVKNNHTMQPWGCVKGKLIPSEQTCTITLSNKSQDGLTFNYNSDILITPHIGDYVFQDDFCNRSWITAVDTVNYTVSFEMPDLDNGVGHYSKGKYVDCIVRDWHPIMYLWGMDFRSRDGGYDDFLEFAVVDKDDLFLIDDVTQVLFGVNAADARPYLEAIGFENNGEYGHWTKYYDEQWTINACSKSLKTPDGAPGALMPGLYLRMAYFTSKTDSVKTHFYVDYYPTSRDEDV